MTAKSLLYYRHRFPPKIISQLFASEIRRCRPKPVCLTLGSVLDLLLPCRKGKAEAKV